MTCELMLRLSEVDSVFESDAPLFIDSFFALELCCSLSDAVSVVEANLLSSRMGDGFASGGILYPLWVRQCSSYSFCITGSEYLILLAGCPTAELANKRSINILT